jgi:hypothetical protein
VSLAIQRQVPGVGGSAVKSHDRGHLPALTGRYRVPLSGADPLLHFSFTATIEVVGVALQAGVVPALAGALSVSHAVINSAVERNPFGAKVLPMSAV